MHGMLLGYSFEPRPNSRVFAAEDSVMTIGLSINRCSHSKKKQFDVQTSTPLTKIGGKGGVCTQASTLATLANGPLYSYR